MRKKTPERRVWAFAIVGAIVMLTGAIGLGLIPNPLEALRGNRPAPAAEADGRLASEPVTIITSTGRHVFDAEIARAAQDQARGLMFRRAMPSDHAMLFVHEVPDELTMWMRNTLIPLDMIFILEDGTVHRVAEDAQPHSETIIRSNGKVVAVLEVNAGTARRLDIRTGDKVLHSHFNSKP